MINDPPVPLTSTPILTLEHNNQITVGGNGNYTYVVDPITGYLELDGNQYKFSAIMKKKFVESYLKNGLALYKTSKQYGLRYETVNKHWRIDPKFRADMDHARNQYAESLDGVSKTNAMRPKSVIERIFQLKSLYPTRYSDQKTQPVSISINIDSQTLSKIQNRDKIIDAKIVEDQSSGVPALSDNSHNLPKKGEMIDTEPHLSIQSRT